MRVLSTLLFLSLYNSLAYSLLNFTFIILDRKYNEAPSGYEFR